ncbi:MAG: type 1 glutamine amidotransferase [Pseudomonadota bacterium]|nr:type 1 glutamine amidotransferase [Pseudomonadota bacterium]
MARRILVLEHADLPGPDAALAHLRARGAAATVVHAWKGETVPDPAGFDGLMVMGGAQMVTDRDALPWMDAEFAALRVAHDAGMPMLCICLGAQMLAHVLGARVGPHPEGRLAFGFEPLRALPVAPGAAPNPIPDGLQALCGNAQGFDMPAGAERLAAGTGAWPNPAFRTRRALALQFHPEVTRPILDVWQAEWPEAHARPGGQPKARQDADFPRLDPPLKAWLRATLETLFDLAPAPAETGAHRQS